MNIRSIREETILAAADRKVLNRDLREGVMHLKVDETFYGSVTVPDDTFISSMEICTIANLVGEYTVELAVKNNFINRDNIITIQGVPHAQYAKMLD